jgi:1-acyl-sn-glycerol-3-phosphate acyltransferase/protein-tyrosine phosphatase/membrane-associated phospholipid phosphatase
MKALAARRSAALALLFLGVYGGCNWLTAQRADVGVWFFEWERRIPFWPILIVPYLSIDAFFLAAPFLCRDRQELRAFTARIATAIVIAGLCFLAFPLRFAFERPAVDGWVGALLNGFTALDRPFNLFPSLHVTLAVILANTYARHTRGFLRTAVLGWFVLIAVSTIFTYQHHVVDVAGGLLLATLVCFVIHEDGASPVRLSHNVRVGFYYGVGSGTAAVLSALAWPWTAPLLWPAISLAIVGAGYLWLGPRVFWKTAGRIPLFARMLLWPCLAGQQLSLRYYRRQCRPYDVVAPRVWIGRQLDAHEAAAAVSRGVTAVLDLTAEFDAPPAFTRTTYKNLPTLDLTAPSSDALAEAVQFVTHESQRGVVYVQCKVGYSRSATVVAAWLLASRQASHTGDALATIRCVRPQAVIRPEASAAIRHFEQSLESARLSSARTLHDQRGRRQSPGDVIVSAILGAAARIMCGAPQTATGFSIHPRIYFANHTSHLDFVALWGSLPPEVRANTRPVVGRDYWQGGPIRRLIARHVLRAVLVERAQDPADRRATITAARQSVDCAAQALFAGESLIIFPEGTRGSGEHIGPFKSGLYHLCLRHPEVEVVPVLLENLHRILPKGAMLPVPVSGSIVFGAPIRLRPGEEKQQFLTRARAALLMVNAPCTRLSTPISRAS